MSEFRLLLRNLSHHWRTNLAVVFGVIAGTAVIGGALVVGDSVRGSLRQMTLDRLGRIDAALVPGRFFREHLVTELGGRPGFKSRFPAVAPALLLNGTFVAERAGGSTRAGRVQVFGCDERLWELVEAGGASAPQGREAVLNERLAKELKVQPGDDVSLFVQLPSAIPRESLLGKREADIREIPLTVRAILGASTGAGRLSLNANQQLPLDAFVPLKALQESLGLAHQNASRKYPRGEPARVNAIFAALRSDSDPGGPDGPKLAKELTANLVATIGLTDIGLRIVDSGRGYVSLESQQQILDDASAALALRSAERIHAQTSPVLAYLANEVESVKDPKKLSMYSVVAGLDPVTTTMPPFGPFAWASPVPDHPLGPGEIVLNDWIAADLGVGVSDEVRLRYHLVGSHGELPEEERTFRVAGIVKLEGPAADPRIVPEVKGITDAKTLRDWDQPFPMKLNLVTKRDEAYWDKYRATPKSFVSLPEAQRLWGSRFGSLTSVRVAEPKGQSWQQTAINLQSGILRRISSTRAGLDFQPVKYDGLRSASGSNDFSQLFLGFSFFLILAATILVGLLFRLGIERRGTSIGVLSAVGFAPRQIRRIFLEEGLVLVVVGGLLGTGAAVAFAELMILGLKLWWNRAVGTQFLSVFVIPSTLAIGFGASVVVTALAILWGLRQLRFLSPRELLSGATEPPLTAAKQRRRRGLSLHAGVALLALAAISLAAFALGMAPRGEAFEGLSWNVVLFFLDGMVMLVAGVLLLAGLLDADHAAAVRGRGLGGIARLGIRNTARHRQRSVTSVALIAAATFVIVAVAAGRRNPAVETPELHSGNGGFRLVAQSTEPILFDLDTPAGRDKLDLRIDPKTADAAGVAELLASSRFFALRVKPGEDASCLNVYQTRMPTVLGVPRSLIDRGGFRFIGGREPNPWTVLEGRDADGSIPVVGDANTLQYSLHKGMGETITVPDRADPKPVLRIAGMLDGSVFQGVLLMSEENFQQVFPEINGYRYFLVDVPGPAANADRLSDFLETRLAPAGFDAERVADRLADFLAVQNTYLSTFQTLGGLGLLLGTFGLATVMIRNVLERRGELALLNALGLERPRLAWLVLVETAVLLISGLATGTVAALVAMLPHLSSIGADVPWGSLAVVLSIVFVVSMLAALAASVQAARVRILEALRSE